MSRFYCVQGRRKFRKFKSGELFPRVIMGSFIFCPTLEHDSLAQVIFSCWNQTRRSFNHGTMRKVCDVFTRSQKQPFPTPYDVLLPIKPNYHIFFVAEAFAELQEACYAADYDLSTTVYLEDAKRLWALGQNACTMLSSFKELPETTVFLTALLLADRWTRRG